MYEKKIKKHLRSKSLNWFLWKIVGTPAISTQRFRFYKYWVGLMMAIIYSIWMKDSIYTSVFILKNKTSIIVFKVILPKLFYWLPTDWSLVQTFALRLCFWSHAESAPILLKSLTTGFWIFLLKILWRLLFKSLTKK